MKKLILEFSSSFSYLLFGAIVEIVVLNYLPLSNFIFQILLIAVGYAASFGVFYTFFNKVDSTDGNPIFTFSSWLLNKISNKEFITIIVSQILGGFVAGFLLWLVFSESIKVLALGYGSFSMFQSSLDSIILIEFLFSFVFVIVRSILQDKIKLKKYQGLILGFLFFCLLFFSIPYTGGSVNPVRPLLSNLYVNQDCLRQSLFYILSPLAGSLFASIIYHIYHQIMNNVFK